MRHLALYITYVQTVHDYYYRRLLFYIEPVRCFVWLHSRCQQQWHLLNRPELADATIYHRCRARVSFISPEYRSNVRRTAITSTQSYASLHNDSIGQLVTKCTRHGRYDPKASYPWLQHLYHEWQLCSKQHIWRAKKIFLSTRRVLVYPSYNGDRGQKGSVLPTRSDSTGSLIGIMNVSCRYWAFNLNMIIL